MLQLPSSTPPSFLLHYTPLSLLGKGGYGTVYLCRRKSDHRVFAAKLLARVKRVSWCRARKCWIPEEVALWEPLSHSNLLHLEAIYNTASSWVLVMEYCPGYVDMFDYVCETGPLPVEDVRVVLGQLVECCYYLVSEGVDHRDIKDENILYNPTTRHIKLLDFGSSSPLGDAAYTSYRGTAVYLPPEFYTYGRYEALPATTWAIGCLAYTLLNGDAPFNNTTQVQEHKTLHFRNKNLDQHSRAFLQEMLGHVAERAWLSDLSRNPWMTTPKIWSRCC